MHLTPEAEMVRSLIDQAKHPQNLTLQILNARADVVAVSLTGVLCHLKNPELLETVSDGVYKQGILVHKTSVTLVSDMVLNEPFELVAARMVAVEQVAKGYAGDLLELLYDHLGLRYAQDSVLGLDPEKYWEEMPAALSIHKAIWPHVQNLARYQLIDVKVPF